MNTNCLEGMRCPKCGNTEELIIEMKSLYQLTDDGTGENEDTEWDSSSYCVCPSCRFENLVGAFYVSNWEKLRQVFDACIAGAECKDCETFWIETALNPVDWDKLFKEVGPGNPLPSGACPHCGGLCYRTMQNEFDRVCDFFFIVTPPDQWEETCDEEDDQVEGG